MPPNCAYSGWPGSITIDLTWVQCREPSGQAMPWPAAASAIAGSRTAHTTNDLRMVDLPRGPEMPRGDTVMSVSALAERARNGEVGTKRCELPRRLRK